MCNKPAFLNAPPLDTIIGWYMRAYCPRVYYSHGNALMHQGGVSSFFDGSIFSDFSFQLGHVTSVNKPVQCHFDGDDG